VVDPRGPADALGLVGATIDQVRFDACVDAGGFGLIYRGYHQGLGETVAIKCLRIAAIQKTNAAMREALAGRFRDEVKLLYRLSQGNLDIVRCIGSGTLIATTTNEYTPYMILEWLDGCTLSAELKERRRRKLGARSLEDAMTLLDSAAGALSYAHTHDVVHRDVKPGNLFLTRTREGVRMKVLDFGLAKILSDEAIGIRPSVETGVGVHFCSPSYGAPEQFTASMGKIGPWTDVYSLAMVLLEVMVGDKVRQAGTLAEGLLKAIDKKTGSPTASSLGLRLPPAVEEVLARAVAQDPVERPHDVGVFWTLLKAAASGGPKRDLNATVADDGVNEAMLQVRAAQAAGQPSPFTGTMLMQSAPAGAPHLMAPLPAAGRPPEAAPAAGRPPEAPPADAEPKAPQQGVSRSTSPLKPPLAATMPFGAMSPMAASMVMQPSQRPSLGPQGEVQARHQSGPPPPFSAAPPPLHGGFGQGRPRSEGRVGATTERRVGETPTLRPKRSSAVLFLVTLAALVSAGMGFAFYWLRVRGH
jgi:serine/threonine-protein kinase